MEGILRACGTDWNYYEVCSVSVHSNLVVLKYAKY